MRRIVSSRSIGQMLALGSLPLIACLSRLEVGKMGRGGRWWIYVSMELAEAEGCK